MLIERHPTELVTEQAKHDAWRTLYYHTIKGGNWGRAYNRKNWIEWKGTMVCKLPADLVLYHQVIWENKPDFIVETGTKFGGSALFFCDMLDLTGKGKVITVDKVKKDNLPSHPRLTYLNGNSRDKSIINAVKEFVKGGTVMVVLDSWHGTVHVQHELYQYGRIVTPGQFIVVEDVYPREGNRANGPGPSVDWFVEKYKDRFRLVPYEDQFIGHLTRGGWIERYA